MEKLFEEYKLWLTTRPLASSTQTTYLFNAQDFLNKGTAGLSPETIASAKKIDASGLQQLHEFLEQNKLKVYQEKVSFTGIESFRTFVLMKAGITGGSKFKYDFPTRQIILQGPPGTGKTREAKDLAYKLIFQSALSKEPDTRKQQLEELHQSPQFKIIQFHPAYSYEDFVRGIVAKPFGNSVEYKTENKILALHAKAALYNYVNSQKDPEEQTTRHWVEQSLKDYADSVVLEIEAVGKENIGDTEIYIFGVEEDAFRYKGDNWSMHEKGLRMKFSDLVQMYVEDVKTRQDVKKMGSISGLAIQHASYYFKVFTSFKTFLKTRPKQTEVFKEELKNFVLIIDEINRANLPAVLGELIYALEYRGEAVSSMYEIDGDREIVIPPNLYLIGTMNTADRSVGHIDYAIRRRFSFVDVLPNADAIGNPVAKKVFNEIQELFTTQTSPDFNVDDIRLGHSYFIVDNNRELKQRLVYEVQPVLKEYVKDGVLLNDEVTKDFIKTFGSKIEAISE